MDARRRINFPADRRNIAGSKIGPAARRDGPPSSDFDPAPGPLQLWSYPSLDFLKVRARAVGGVTSRTRHWLGHDAGTHGLATRPDRVDYRRGTFASSRRYGAMSAARADRSSCARLQRGIRQKTMTITTEKLCQLSTLFSPGEWHA